MALAALALVVSAGAAGAQEVLQIIPDDAIGFALVNRVGATNEKVAALANKLKIPMPGSPLDMHKGALGVEKGLAEKGSLAIAAFAGKDGSDEPSPLFIVPVSNYQDFIKQFEPDDASAPIAAIKLKDGKELVAAKRGNYAMMAPVADRALLARVIAPHARDDERALRRANRDVDARARLQMHEVRERLAHPGWRRIAFARCICVSDQRQGGARVVLRKVAREQCDAGTRRIEQYVLRAQERDARPAVAPRVQ